MLDTLGRRWRIARSLRRGFRNWPFLLARAALRRPAAAPRPLAATTRGGTRLTIPGTRAAPTVLTEVYAEDAYGLRRMGLPEDATVIDIGAHVGVFALMVHELYARARVHAFEPSPSSFEYLAGNVRDNGAQASVTVRNVAVTARGGVISFHSDDAASTGASAYVARPGTHPMTVDSVSFQSVTSELDGPIDLVKMDCEGGEYDIVLNSSYDCWSRVRRLTCEYHPIKGGSFEELRARLVALGFTLRANHTYGPNWGLADFSRD